MATTSSLESQVEELAREFRGVAEMRVDQVLSEILDTEYLVTNPQLPDQLTEFRRRRSDLLSPDRLLRIDGFLMHHRLGEQSRGSTRIILEGAIQRLHEIVVSKPQNLVAFIGNLKTFIGTNHNLRQLGIVKAHLVQLLSALSQANKIPKTSPIEQRVRQSLEYSQRAAMAIHALLTSIESMEIGLREPHVSYLQTFCIVASEHAVNVLHVIIKGGALQADQAAETLDKYYAFVARLIEKDPQGSLSASIMGKVLAQNSKTAWDSVLNFFDWTSKGAAFFGERFLIAFAITIVALRWMTKRTGAAPSRAPPLAAARTLGEASTSPRPTPEAPPMAAGLTTETSSVIPSPRTEAQGLPTFTQTIRFENVTPNVTLTEATETPTPVSFARERSLDAKDTTKTSSKTGALAWQDLTRKAGSIEDMLRKTLSQEFIFFNHLPSIYSYFAQVWDGSSTEQREAIKDEIREVTDVIESSKSVPPNMASYQMFRFAVTSHVLLQNLTSSLGINEKTDSSTWLRNATCQGKDTATTEKCRAKPRTRNRSKTISLLKMLNNLQPNRQFFRLPTLQKTLNYSTHLKLNAARPPVVLSQGHFLT